MLSKKCLKNSYLKRIISKKSIKSILNEKKIWVDLNHSFIVNMILSFQDRHYLYLLIDLMIGGDLRFHICIKKKFSEQKIKFFAACLILGLEYLYNNQIIHRDIKPENIVLDEKGYLKITDFGISKKFSIEGSKETSGTPGYMAPEVLLRENHSYEVDYFALGVILYECIKGKRPYLGNNRKEIKNQVLSFQAKIKKEEVIIYSNNCLHFVNSLIQRNKKIRLGYNGIHELKNHRWFDNFDWDKLYKKELSAPFIPNIKTFFDYLKQLSEETKQETKEYNVKINKNLFKDYSYNNHKKLNYIDKDVNNYKNKFDKLNLNKIKFKKKINLINKNK